MELSALGYKKNAHPERADLTRSGVSLLMQIYVYMLFMYILFVKFLVQYNYILEA